MSDMTMVERVARSLCIDAGEHPDTPTPYNPNADYIWQFYRKAAIAAIEAMRGPTEAMVEAGGEAYYGHPRASAVEWAKEDKFDLHANDAAIFYGSMIDAALKEHEGEKSDGR